MKTTKAMVLETGRSHSRSPPLSLESSKYSCKHLRGIHATEYLSLIIWWRTYTAQIHSCAVTLPKEDSRSPQSAQGPYNPHEAREYATWLSGNTGEK